MNKKKETGQKLWEEIHFEKFTPKTEKVSKTSKI